ncbi:MAG: hypothetical protein K1X88_04155 [Nannocystaceae bacterium]|nr:hypothetical protein [Nannocystaceae bacterium]
MYAENDYGSPPTATELQGWADNYGMSFPAGADPGWTFYDRSWSANYTPVNLLLAPGMRVVTEDYVDDSQIEAVLPM